MEKSQLIRNIKKLIGDAELKEALDQVIAFLETEDRYEELHRTALHLRAEYQKTARDEARGILSREDAKLSYNQVTHQLLNLLDDLENDTPRQQARRRNIWIAVVVCSIIIGVAGVWLFPGPQENGDDGPYAECPPQFKKASRFNILCLPFVDYAENTFEEGISRAIQDRLNRLSSDYRIRSSAGVYSFPDQATRPYPSAPEDADGYGNNCRAQMVIWGSIEGFPDNDIVTTNWRLVNKGDKFRLRQFQVAEDIDVDTATIETIIDTWGYEVDTITSITSVATEGILTQRIENLLRLIFGIIGHQTNNQEAAIAALEEAQPGNDQELILRNMLLADNYLQTGQPEKAMQPYNEVLDKHPSYKLALTNRALLYYQNEQYEEAARDLTTHLEADPEDATTRLARGAVYLKAERLDKAREDFEEVKKTEKDNPVLRKKETELDTRIQKQKEIKTDAEAVLSRDPDNLQALQQKAEASKKLGEYDLAAESAERLVAKDPKNTAAYDILIDAYRNQERFDKIRETLQKARSGGITPERLPSFQPIRPQIQKTDTLQ